jgi:hypothetical protein
LFARVPTMRTARCSATAATRQCTSSVRALTKHQRCGIARLAWWTPRITFRVQACLLPFAGDPDNAMRLPAGVSAHKTTLHGRAYGRVFRAVSISTSTFHSTMSLQEIPGHHSSGESFNSGNDALRWPTDRVLRTVSATSPPNHARLRQRLHPNRKKNCALGTPSIKRGSFMSSRIPARGRLLHHQFHLRNRNRNQGSSKDLVFADPQPTQARHRQSHLVQLRSVAQ